ncbi:MAG: PIG-L family deacetylase [Planctomycetaceae bacterium]
MAAELPEKLDVIAVGAHPDDVEIAVGGTLAAMVKQGYRVGIVDLTDGEPTPGSSGPEQRLEEARLAAKELGVQVRETLTLPNRRLFDCFEARVELAKVFRRYRPAIVLGLAAKTPMASPDHWQAMQITDAGIFYSRLSKWDEHFDGLPVHTIRKQLWYSLGFSTLESPPSSGAFVVDISATYAQKVAAIRAYRSQFPPGKERVFHLVEGQAQLMGQSAGFTHGELLLAATTLGVRDPVGLLCPDLVRSASSIVLPTP